MPRENKLALHAGRAARRLLAGSLCACVLQFAAVASAQPSDGGEFDRGMAAFNAGRFEAALSAFDVSYRRKPNANTLYQLAVTYAAMGQASRALDTYASFLRVADPAAADTTNIAAATREVGRIQTEAARFTLKLAPPDATIEIDGHAIATRNGELWLMPGKHAISIRAPGYESYAQTLDAQTGRFALEINLRQITTPPEVQVAALLDEGQLYWVQGDRPKALARFREAQAVKPTPRGYAQLGIAEDESGDLASAFEHITVALKSPKDPYIRSHKQPLRTALKRLTRATRNYATLRVIGSPSEARLYLGERSVGTIAGTSTLRVPPGIVLLIARLDGFADAVFESQMPERSLRTAELRLDPLPPVPPPQAPAPPPKAAPRVPPPRTVEPAPIATELKSEPPPIAQEPIVNQADIEAQLREQGQFPDEPRPATGFELNAVAGYQFWLGEGPWDSRGAPALRVSLGARLAWPISFGVSLIDVSNDFANEHTSSLFTLSPGLYVRAHTQARRMQNAVDVWAGAGFVPYAMSFAKFKSPTTTTQRLAGLDADAIERVVDERQNIGRSVRRQSMNIPLEAGITWYVTPGMGITLNAAFVFWLPQELCYRDQGDTHCLSDGLELQHNLFVGAGLSFLP